MGGGCKNFYFIFIFLDENFIYYILRRSAAVLQSHSRFEMLLRAGFFSSEGGPIKLKALSRLKWEGRERVLASDSLPPSETCCLLKQVPSLLCWTLQYLSLGRQGPLKPSL